MLFLKAIGHTRDRFFNRIINILFRFYLVIFLFNLTFIFL